MNTLTLSIVAVAFALGSGAGALWQRRKYNRILRPMENDLKSSSKALDEAVKKNQTNKTNMSGTGTPLVAAALLASLQAQVTATVTADGAAEVLIDGFQQRLNDAVAAAIGNGATAEQLAPIQAEIDAMQASSAALAASVVANTPAATPPPAEGSSAAPGSGSVGAGSGSAPAAPAAPGTAGSPAT